MRARFVAEPNDARRQNGRQVMNLGQTYATAGFGQLQACRHQSGEPCERCQNVNDDMHYFAVALGIVGGAAVEGKQSELFELLTRWAKEHLPDFPAELAGRPLYARDADFPDFIEEAEEEEAK